MLVQTPDRDQRFSLQTVVTDDAMKAFGPHAYEETVNEASKHLLRNIIEKCKVEEYDPDLKVLKIRFDTVVMSEQQYRDAVTNAYVQGLRDKGRFTL
jgi:hypothetical protein